MLESPPFPSHETDFAYRLANEIGHLFIVNDITIDFPEDGSIRYRGEFQCDLAEKFGELRKTFEKYGFTPLIRKNEEGEVILLAMPHVFEPRPVRGWLNLILFIATIGSTMFAGASESIFIKGLWPGILDGWPFSLCILLILGAHELGHYFAARYHNVSVSLPFFIPIPTILGTLGAVIVQREPPPNRRVLLDIGAAGPIAGLVFAIPILIIGLFMSPVEPLPAGGYLAEGNSLLYSAFKFVIKGRVYPWGGLDVSLNQVAWAGWCGLLVTGLNLIPVGQLDGGHMAYVLFGPRSRQFIWPAIVGLVAISIIYATNMWWLWIGLLLLFGRSHAQPLDDVTPLDPRRRMIAILTVFIFILVFVPVPITIVGLG